MTMPAIILRLLVVAFVLWPGVASALPLDFYGVWCQVRSGAVAGTGYFETCRGGGSGVRLMLSRGAVVVERADGRQTWCRTSEELHIGAAWYTRHACYTRNGVRLPAIAFKLVMKDLALAVGECRFVGGARVRCPDPDGGADVYLGQ